MQTTEEASPSDYRSGTTAPDCTLTLVHAPVAAAAAVSALGDVFVVGRDAGGAGLSVDDSRLSRAHFRVVFDRHSLRHQLGDSASRNGTFVNGRRVQSTVLEAGDVIRAGDCVFVYGPPSPLVEMDRTVARAARAALSVAVSGETGVGKERVARALHDQSGRGGPFVAVNCAALPRELLGAELFGHTRGAFSGAARARTGLLIAADGGTLLLDEVGDFPIDMQAALLRVLEEGTVRPVGSDSERHVDVRVVCATHVDLDGAVRDGAFRGDLYARLAQIKIHVPPLRARRSEITTLAGSFAKQPALRELTLTADAAEALVRWNYPYNVRELQAVIFGFASLRDGDALDLAYLARRHPEMTRMFRGEGLEPAERPQRGPESRGRLESLLRRHGDSRREKPPRSSACFGQSVLPTLGRTHGRC